MLMDVEQKIIYVNQSQSYDDSGTRLLSRRKKSEVHGTSNAEHRPSSSESPHALNIFFSLAFR